MNSNAFALPRGHVFITIGLLNKLQTEAQIAGVLSHEMGHVMERHSAQQMAKSQLELKLMIQSGFNPKAMIEVMEILKTSDSKNHATEIFHTHSNPNLRIQQIKAYLAEHPPSGNLSEGRNLNEVFKSNS